MKIIYFIWLFILVQYSNGQFFDSDLGLQLGPECITLSEMNRATKTLCIEQRTNKTLWNEVIKCHRPMTDEFMRSSSEARCPNPKHVQDPINVKNSIGDVFLNICGMVDGNLLQKAQAGVCIIFGKPSTDGKPAIMSHSEEVKEVKKRFGKDLPCNIGKCIKKVFKL